MENYLKEMLVSKTSKNGEGGLVYGSPSKIGNKSLQDLYNRIVTKLNFAKEAQLYLNKPKKHSYFAFENNLKKGREIEDVIIKIERLLEDLKVNIKNLNQYPEDTTFYFMKDKKFGKNEVLKVAEDTKEVLTETLNQYKQALTSLEM